MDPGYNDSYPSAGADHQDAHERSPRNFPTMNKSQPYSDAMEAQSSMYHDDPNSWQELKNVAPKGEPADMKETFKMSPNELRKHGVVK